MNDYIEKYIGRLKRKANLNEVENFDDISEKEIMLLILYKLDLIESFMHKLFIRR